MAIYGYARVSTRDQDFAGQIELLAKAGAKPIFREKVSGAKVNRPELSKLMKVLRAGDIVLVTKLDRLGRSTRELLDLIDRIGKAGAFFKSLGDPLFDTSTATGRLLSTLRIPSSKPLFRDMDPSNPMKSSDAGYDFTLPVPPEPLKDHLLLPVETMVLSPEHFAACHEQIHRRKQRILNRRKQS